MISRTAKQVIRLHNKRISMMAFCYQKALLDPSKHNTMSHRGHNIFIDLYDFGEYPEIIDNTSVAPKTYQPIVLDTIVKVLNAKYGITMTEQNITQKQQKEFARFIKKDLKSQDKIKQLLPSLLNNLAVNIYVRESRWTWIKEQKKRLQFSSKYFTQNPPANLKEFISSYNELIQELVLASSYGRSPYIPQAPTPLEKHFVEQMAKSAQNPQGVSQLNKLEGENQNFINNMMSRLHRL